MIFNNKLSLKATSIATAVALMYQIVFPTSAIALTSGPSQPEVQSFEPVSTTQMVDPFTGDFTYNIPLLDVGGYPVNLSYHAGIGMDQEASWVGLGWNINPGVINRNLRGLPDDFKGDKIETVTNILNNTQVGFDPRIKSKVETNDEVFGHRNIDNSKKTVFNDDFTFDETISLNMDEISARKMKFLEESMRYQIYYNNYKGVGYSVNYNGNSESNENNSEVDGSFSIGFDSQSGAYISPSIKTSIGIGKKINENNSVFSINGLISMGYSTRGGLTHMGIGIGLSTSRANYEKTQSCVDVFEHERIEYIFGNNYATVNGYGGGISSTYAFGNASYIPTIRPYQFSFNTNFRLKYYDDQSGTSKPNSKTAFKLDIGLSVNGIHTKTRAISSFGFLNKHYSSGADLIDMDNQEGVSFNKYTNNLRPSSFTYDILGLSGQGTGGSFKPVHNELGFSHEAKNRVHSVSNIGLPVELGYSMPEKEKFKGVNNPAKTYDVDDEQFDFLRKWTHGEKINAVYAKSVKLGIDPTITFVWGASGKWEENDGNQTSSKLEYGSPNLYINSENQRQYYKSSFDKTFLNQDYSNKVGGVYPARFKINNIKPSDPTDNQNLLDIFQLSDQLNSEIGIGNEGVKAAGRQSRKNVIQTLNANEASEYGLNKNLYSYHFNLNTGQLERETIERKSSFRKEHHISEIVSTDGTGIRYVYGLPVYNLEQTEYNFNVGQKNIDSGYLKHGTTGYDANDKGISNNEGIDHYYRHEKLPAYVHSWMLTAVLSSDYVDVTGDGPTNDDLGTYTRFNYTKLASGQSIDDEGVYCWRFPFGEREGYLNRGLKADDLDDKVSVTSGKREVWYLQSVETKTHIAIFHMSDREDGVESSASIDGGLGVMRLKKLDRIDLFNLKEFYQHPMTCVPIKSVHFEYSYDLCAGVRNNSGYLSSSHPLSSIDPSYNRLANSRRGKLTLNKLYFTYGSSLKGSLSPYYFQYLGLNPNYKPKSVDRWGNYMPWNKHNGLPDNFSGVANGLFSNTDYPFVPQDDVDDVNVDQWASAWCLTDISLPSGGKIRVEYESDDYAYVQDRKAMQMVKISGYASSVNITEYPNGDMYDTDKKFKPYIFFKLPDNCADIMEMTNGIRSVLANTFVMLNQGGVPLGYDSKYESIRSYLDLELDGNQQPVCGTKTLSGINYGWVKIKSTFIGDHDNGVILDDKINPITKEAYRLLRQEFPYLAYSGSDVRRSDNNVDAMIGSLLASGFSEMAKVIVGYERYLFTRKYAYSISPELSYIRLNNPDGSKNGGGHRVKRILLSDNWNSMTGNQEQTFETGTEYDYSIIQDEEVISSGVASYEPLVGGDENPFRERIQFDDGSFTLEEKNLFAPNNFVYEEGPIGESSFQSAIVGYSRVRARSVLPSQINAQAVKKHSTGTKEYNFYTSKDFPTITKRTPIDVSIRKNIALGLLGISKQKATASQGFVIEVNDMHGRPKSIMEYGENDDVHVISGIEYEYQIDNAFVDRKHLNNKVNAINPDGSISKDVQFGLEIEASALANRSEHNSITTAAQVNLELLYPNSGTPPIIPLLSIVPSASFSKSVTQFVTFTKLVNRFGVLKRIKVTNDDATLVTENLLWDSETGDVLLQRTMNEYTSGTYQAWDYNLTKPAHWVEKGMAGAYLNSDALVLLSTTGTINPGEVELSSSSLTGMTNLANIRDLLFPGDELIAASLSGSQLPNNLINNGSGDAYANTANPTSYEKYWVLSVENGKANLIDKFGNPIPHDVKPYFFRILRSGHRNQLDAIAESVIMQSDPTSVVGVNWRTLTTMDNVISGSAMLFSDKWQTYFSPEMKARVGCELSVDPYYEEIEDKPPYTSVVQAPGRAVDFANTSNWPEYGLCQGKTYLLPGQSVNPYILGIRGNWRPWYSMVYFDRTDAGSTRIQDWTSNDPNAINNLSAGLISGYVPFYQFQNWKWTPQWTPSSNGHNKWTWKSRSSYIGPNGEALEAMDVLGISSSALYGYSKTLPIAVITNAKHEESLYDGFEEYDEGYFTVDCAPGNALNLSMFPDNSYTINLMYKHFSICNQFWHWPMWKALANGNARVSKREFHTGNQSLSVTSPVTPGQGGAQDIPSALIPLEPNPTSPLNSTILNGRYFLGWEDFIPQFYPENTTQTDQYYLLSYWVKGQGELKVMAQNGFILQSVETGPAIIIDNWKRIELKITVPAGSSIGSIAFYNYNQPYPNTGGSGLLIQNYPPLASIIKPVYFDDIRIHPFMANMDSYVYDKINSRLMATLDENNFATYFEYDLEGNLVRTKVETEKGIMTVSETRSSVRKKP